MTSRGGSGPTSRAALRVAYSPVLADRAGRAIVVSDPPKTVGHREIG
ncbi:hypothetical protein MMEU_4619 [Mycobacterium marinum str. Europe]|nr:hypothetical protein MMEU_4619 [Mycobacterium marinum str. Europe]